MQSLSAVVAIGSLLLCFILKSTEADDDDCRPMPPFLKGERKVHPRLCCSLESLMPEAIDASYRMCLHKYTSPNSTSSVAPMTVEYKPIVMPMSKAERTCLGECVFNESGLLTPDKEINREALSKLFNGAVASNKDAAPVMTAALNKCFNTYEDMIDEDLECSSGSEELRKCIVREIFLNCPVANWNASTECIELKNKHSKCPNLWIMGPQTTMTSKTT